MTDTNEKPSQEEPGVIGHGFIVKHLDGTVEHIPATLRVVNLPPAERHTPDSGAG